MEIKIFAVFGNPVAHSLSPLMHQAALERMGIAARYVPFCVTDLKKAVEGIRGLNIIGVSVTLPFKTEVMAYLDAIDDKARRMGAVNTIWNDRAGLKGYNTDWLGFVLSLKEHLEIRGKRFAVLGAGGAARGVVFGLMEEGGLPQVINRTPEKAMALAQDFGCPFIPWGDLNRVEAEVLINTTPLGMTPNLEKSPWPKELLKKFKWVADIIYNPLQTRLLREAEAAGCRTVSGLGMFVHQGAEQLKIWTGQEPPRDLMGEVVRKRLEENENH
ncbi:MAG: shikimate dehydrogenase [Thermodesulfobacteriota bacterium]